MYFEIDYLVFYVPLKNNYLYGDVTITGEGLQNLGWDELEDLAVMKPKGSLEYKAIVKKLGERHVSKRRVFLSR